VIRSVQERPVSIHTDHEILNADLSIPSDVKAIILFAHGSGSSRLSPRNRFVARHLNNHGFATLLIDLLTDEEERRDEISGHLRFDIGLLADRLHGATRWLRTASELRGFPVGYFGASTGAAAALVASLRHPSEVKAIVSRGGRPDLAGPALARVTAPTLLVVGSKDKVVAGLNEEAVEDMQCLTHTEIIEGATHLFEEPGTLDSVANLAVEWFDRYLCT
jgi:pimeloyl-ACP methyl ester carboxylesterase